MYYPYNPNEDKNSQPNLWLALVILVVLIALYHFFGNEDAADDERNATTAFYPSRPSVEQQTTYREEMQAQADLIRVTSKTKGGAQ